jgi:hypothetical protein
MTRKIRGFMQIRILILTAILLSLSACLATPRFFPTTYEVDKEKKVLKK